MELKNACIFAALSTEMSRLDGLLGNPIKTNYFLANESFKAKKIDEKKVYYKISKKLGFPTMSSREVNSHDYAVAVNEYENNNCIVVSNPGIFNAYFAAKMIDKSKYGKFINIGTAGALDETLKLGDIIAANAAYFIDNKKLINKGLAKIEGFIEGGILSFPEFLDKDGKIHYSKEFNNYGIGIKAVDMELFALANEIPGIYSFKIISDESSHDDCFFSKNFNSLIGNEYNKGIEKIFEAIKSIQ